jgi:ATP-dependent exoDNAse (exonuclease V) beta subunit
VEPPHPPGAEAEPAPDPALDPLLRGTVVHGLLERLDFASPVVPAAGDVEAAIGLHGVDARPAEVADIRDMVERVAGSALRRRIAAARRVRTELPFAFTIPVGRRSLLVNGVVDMYADEEARALVVDWKSDVLGEREPEAVTREGYATQRIIYALAALRAGAEVVEVVHCFLERPDEPAVAIYEAGDAEALERELLELARGVVEGRFEPSPDPQFSLCADCPGRAALCVHEPELTLRLSVQASS